MKTVIRAFFRTLRLVLGWAVSDTMDTGLCLSALRQALDSTGVVPEIFNTDQGSRFTSVEWTGVLLEQGIRISMDGIGRWMDNVFIERLWRSVKYEDVYLKAYDGVSAARQSLASYFEFYNARRPHQSHDGRTPDMVYFKAMPPMQAAA